MGASRKRDRSGGIFSIKCCANGLDRDVGIGPQHILHLHRLDDGERLARLDGLPLDNVDRAH
jgi:hypothetical protein